MPLKKEPTTPAPIEGVPVVLGGYEYIVPALSLFHVRQFAPRLKQLDMSGQIDVSSIDLIAEVAHAAIKRNYPEITLEELLGGIDMANMMVVYQTIMGVSGYQAKADGGTPAGESIGRS